MRFHHRSLPLLGISLAIFILVGCSHQSTKSNSLEAVQTRLNETHPELAIELDAKDKNTTINSLIAQPLTPQTSMQLMLLNSPRIESELSKLGIADAAQVQSELISNPRFSFALLTPEKLKPENSNHWLWDLGLSQPLVELFTRSTRKQQAKNEMIETQLNVNHSLEAAISDLEQEYFAAIAAQQNLAIQKNLLDAETAKKELAENLYKAGNISQLDYLAYLVSFQKQERMFATQEGDAIDVKSNLAYLLGLTSESINLPTALPAIPQENFDANALIADAKTNRLDIQLIQQHQQLLNTQLTLIKKEYGIADSNIGLVAKRESDGVRSNGVQADIAIPIFDNGQGKIAAVNAQISTTHADIKDTQLRITRDIQQAIRRLNAARLNYVRLEQEQLVTEKRLELLQQEINFMLSSPFELIELKATEIQLEQEKTITQLMYWQARSQLELAAGKQIKVVDTKISGAQK